METTNSSAIATTSSEEPQDAVCIFCGEADTKKKLRKAATLGLDKKVKECAKILDDKNPLAKLAGGDMIAIDAVYHCSCLTKLYRRAETVGCYVSDTSEVQVIKAHVFNELLDFTEDN